MKTPTGPDASLLEAPGFVLGEARASERVARDRLTHDAWGSSLTREQFLDRERTLRQTAHGRLSMRSWVLRLPNGAVCASAETFRLPLHPGGAVEVVASVFVDRALRGVGMASRLMAHLVKARREAGIDALVLFSEVGAGLYERAGFRALPAPGRIWPVGGPGLLRMTPITRETLPEALERRRRLREGRLDLHLTPEIVDWHLARSDFYARELGRSPATEIGVISDDVVALWVPDYRANVLRLLDVTGAPGTPLEPVVVSARAMGVVNDLDRVVLWDDEVSAALPSPTARPRDDDDLPMGLPFTPRGELVMGPLSRAWWA